MNTENIKKIAEGLGLEYLEGEVFDRHPIDKTPYNRRLFNPFVNDADAFNVLEALVKWRAKESLDTSIMDLSVYGTTGYCCSSTFGEKSEEKDLKHAICEAYLSLIDNKRV
jgi:hypothetical protein